MVEEYILAIMADLEANGGQPLPHVKSKTEETLVDSERDSEDSSNNSDGDNFVPDFVPFHLEEEVKKDVKEDRGNTFVLRVSEPGGMSDKSDKEGVRCKVGGQCPQADSGNNEEVAIGCQEGAAPLSIDEAELGELGLTSDQILELDERLGNFDDKDWGFVQIMGNRI